MKVPAAVLTAALTAWPVAAEPGAPPRRIIVDMAQHFVQEHFMHGDKGHYHIEFDTAQLHPQPDENFWAVVGGFVSDQTKRNIFVAAVRLVCADYAKVECWSLEKLAINRTIVVDRGRPL